MELVVKLHHLLGISLGRVEIGQINVLLQLIQLILCDVIARPPRAKSLQSGADLINIADILLGDSDDICSLVRNDGHKTLQFQLAQCLPDRSPADTQFLSDGFFF